MEVPDGGVVFTASGNFGSSVYDPNVGGSVSKFLRLVVCDVCAVELGGGDAILRSIIQRRWSRNRSQQVGPGW
jgi:hypothetical protein